MFPLRDNIPSRHEPHMVWALLTVNVVVFLIIQGLIPPVVFNLFHIWGVVPARFFNPQWAALHGYPGDYFLPLITHMFLHSGWLHLIGNMWMLWIFGDNVEDIMGPLRFFIFYILCGLGALGAHMVLSPQSTIPVVGASGAIAGVMGAYFFLYPQAKVVTFIPILIIPFVFEISAFFFLGAWLLLQILSGLTHPDGGGGVAWWAHIGGFLVGMFLLRFFRNDARCPQCVDPGARRE